MKIQPILYLSVCGVLAACNGSSERGGAPLPAHDLGDVVPRTLYERPTPAVAGGLAQASMPVTPRDRVLTPKQGTERRTFGGSLERLPAPAPNVVEIPVDTISAQTWLYIQPAAPPDAVKAALADIQVLTPAGEQIHAGDGAMELTAYAPGVYRIVVGPQARRFGMTIELAQPDSPITLGLQTSAVVHFPDEATTVAVRLFDGKAPLTGARISAELVTPAGATSSVLGVKEIGSGIYQVLVAPALRVDDTTGMYTVHVRAEGTTRSGVRFMKSGAAAVAYGVPTARITEVMPMRIVKRSATAIEAFEVDVHLEVASTDRYEVTGILATTYRGVPHRVCLAQTADVLPPGERSLTLRFDAGLVKLTGLQGTFQLEQLQLFSQGRAELLHRIPRGLAAIRATDVKHANLVEVTERTPALDEMIAQKLFTLE